MREFQDLKFTKENTASRNCGRNNRTAFMSRLTGDRPINAIKNPLQTALLASIARRNLPPSKPPSGPPSPIVRQTPIFRHLARPKEAENTEIP